MAEDAARTDAPTGSEAEIEEILVLAKDLARKLRAFGVARVSDIGTEVEAESEALVRRGKRMAADLGDRLRHVEAQVERSLRDQPGTWLGGLLGAIGFGLVLGMILRRRD